MEDCVFGDKDVESSKTKDGELTVDVDKEDSSELKPRSFMSRSFKKIKSAATAGISADIHDTVGGH